MFELRDAEVPLIVEICRRLDGNPLAIELAAGHVDLLGVRGLAASLDQGLHLLIRGRRTALPRHQTLRAMLDWSYELLSAPEQAILCNEDLAKTQRRHAEMWRTSGAAEIRAQRGPDWLTVFARRMDDLRAARVGSPNGSPTGRSQPRSGYSPQTHVRRRSAIGRRPNKYS